jgi:hypothetical protein
VTIVRVEAPRRTRDDDRHGVASDIVTPDGAYTVWFRSAAPLADDIVDPFVTLALLPAMRRGWTVDVGAPVSARLLRGMDRVQEVFCGWRAAEFRRVAVRAEERREPFAARGGRAHAFFSCGVDSFYTAMFHREEIGGAVFVLGFDVPLHDTRLAARVRTAARSASREIGFPLVEMETNLREFLDRHCDWNDAHGAALGAVAQLLAPRTSRVLVPSSKPFRHFHLMGSHFAIDPWWSTERVEIHHDGGERSRVGKIAALADFEPAQRWLRVCWKNPDGAYNCGRCSKCLRTMAYLESAGALGRFRTFDRPLSLAALRRVRIRDRNAHQIEDALALLRARGGNRRLASALHAMIVRPPARWKTAARRLGLSALAAALRRRRLPAAASSAAAAGAVPPALRPKRGRPQ